MVRLGSEGRVENGSNAMCVRALFPSSAGAGERRGEEECPSWEGIARDEMPSAQVLGFSEGTDGVREEAKRQSVSPVGILDSH